MTRRLAAPAARRIETGAARADLPGDRLRCMVLAPGPDEWAAVDVASGAILRSRGPFDSGDAPPSSLEAGPLDVVEIELADDVGPTDMARPEAVTLAGTPEHLGRPRRRQARRLLRHLALRTTRFTSARSPAARLLLGPMGFSVALFELDGTSPSVAVLEPDRPPVMTVAHNGSVRCLYVLGGTEQRLPVHDATTLAALAGRNDVRFGGGLADALGFQPRYLVVALTAPVGGHVPKAVIGVLPRP
jgi:hypothetical protein